MAENDIDRLTRKQKARAPEPIVAIGKLRNLKVYRANLVPTVETYLAEAIGYVENTETGERHPIGYQLGVGAEGKLLVLVQHVNVGDIAPEKKVNGLFVVSLDELLRGLIEVVHSRTGG